MGIFNIILNIWIWLPLIVSIYLIYKTLKGEGDSFSTSGIIGTVLFWIGFIFIVHGLHQFIQIIYKMVIPFLMLAIITNNSKEKEKIKQTFLIFGVFILLYLINGFIP